MQPNSLFLESRNLRGKYDSLEIKRNQPGIGTMRTERGKYRGRLQAPPALYITSLQPNEGQYRNRNEINELDAYAESDTRAVPIYQRSERNLRRPEQLKTEIYREMLNDVFRARGSRSRTDNATFDKVLKAQRDEFSRGIKQRLHAGLNASNHDALEKTQGRNAQISKKERFATFPGIGKFRQRQGAGSSLYPVVKDRISLARKIPESRVEEGVVLKASKAQTIKDLHSGLHDQTYQDIEMKSENGKAPLKSRGKTVVIFGHNNLRNLHQPQTLSPRNLTRKNLGERNGFSSQEFSTRKPDVKVVNNVEPTLTSIEKGPFIQLKTRQNKRTKEKVFLEIEKREHRKLDDERNQYSPGEFQNDIKSSRRKLTSKSQTEYSYKERLGITPKVELEVRKFLNQTIDGLYSNDNVSKGIKRTGAFKNGSTGSKKFEKEKQEKRGTIESKHTINNGSDYRVGDFPEDGEDNSSLPSSLSQPRMRTTEISFSRHLSNVTNQTTVDGEANRRDHTREFPQNQKSYAQRNDSALKSNIYPFLQSGHASIGEERVDAGQSAMDLGFDLNSTLNDSFLSPMVDTDGRNHTGNVRNVSVFNSSTNYDFSEKQASETNCTTRSPHPMEIQEYGRKSNFSVDNSEFYNRVVDSNPVTSTIVKDDIPIIITQKDLNSSTTDPQIINTEALNKNHTAPNLTKSSNTFFKADDSVDKDSEPAVSSGRNLVSYRNAEIATRQLSKPNITRRTVLPVTTGLLVEGGNQTATPLWTLQAVGRHGQQTTSLGNSTTQSLVGGLISTSHQDGLPLQTGNEQMSNSTSRSSSNRESVPSKTNFIKKQNFLGLNYLAEFVKIVKKFQNKQNNNKVNETSQPHKDTHIELLYLSNRTKDFDCINKNNKTSFSDSNTLSNVTISRKSQNETFIGSAVDIAAHQLTNFTGYDAKSWSGQGRRANKLDQQTTTDNLLDENTTRQIPLLLPKPASITTQRNKSVTEVTQSLSKQNNPTESFSKISISAVQNSSSFFMQSMTNDSQMNETLNIFNNSSIKNTEGIGHASQINTPNTAIPVDFVQNDTSLKPNSAVVTGNISYFHTKNSSQHIHIDSKPTLAATSTTTNTLKDTSGVSKTATTTEKTIFDIKGKKNVNKTSDNLFQPISHLAIYIYPNNSTNSRKRKTSEYGDRMFDQIHPNIDELVQVSKSSNIKVHSNSTLKSIPFERQGKIILTTQKRRYPSSELSATAGHQINSDISPTATGVDLLETDNSSSVVKETPPAHVMLNKSSEQVTDELLQSSINASVNIKLINSTTHEQWFGSNKTLNISVNLSLSNKTTIKAIEDINSILEMNTTNGTLFLENNNTFLKKEKNIGNFSDSAHNPIVFSSKIAAFPTAAPFDSKPGTRNPGLETSVNDTLPDLRVLVEPSKYSSILLNQSVKSYQSNLIVNQSSFQTNSNLVLVTDVETSTTPSQEAINKNATTSYFALDKVVKDSRNISLSNSSYFSRDLPNASRGNESKSIERTTEQFFLGKEIRQKHIRSGSVEYLENVEAPRWSSSEFVDKAGNMSDLRKSTTDVNDTLHGGNKSGFKWIKTLARNTSAQTNSGEINYFYLDRDASSEERRLSEESTFKPGGSGNNSRQLMNGEGTPSGDLEVAVTPRGLRGAASSSLMETTRRSVDQNLDSLGFTRLKMPPSKKPATHDIDHGNTALPEELMPLKESSGELKTSTDNSIHISHKLGPENIWTSKISASSPSRSESSTIKTFALKNQDQIATVIPLKTPTSMSPSVSDCDGKQRGKEGCHSHRHFYIDTIHQNVLGTGIENENLIRKNVHDPPKAISTKKTLEEKMEYTGKNLSPFKNKTPDIDRSKDNGENRETVDKTILITNRTVSAQNTIIVKNCSGDCGDNFDVKGISTSAVLGEILSNRHARKGLRKISTENIDGILYNAPKQPKDAGKSITKNNTIPISFNGNISSSTHFSQNSFNNNIQRNNSNNYHRKAKKNPHKNKNNYGFHDSNKQRQSSIQQQRNYTNLLQNNNSDHHQRNSRGHYVQNSSISQHLKINNHHQITSNVEKTDNRNEKREYTQAPPATTVMYFIHAVFHPFLPPRFKSQSHINARAPKTPDLNQVGQYSSGSHLNKSVGQPFMSILNNLLWHYGLFHNKPTYSSVSEKPRDALQTQSALTPYEYMLKPHSASQTTLDSRDYWSNSPLNFRNNLAVDWRPNEGRWSNSLPKHLNHVTVARRPYGIDQPGVKAKPLNNFHEDRSFLSMFSDKESGHAWPLWKARPWSAVAANQDFRRTLLPDSSLEPARQYYTRNLVAGVEEKYPPKFILTAMDTPQDKTPVLYKFEHLPTWKAFLRSKGYSGPSLSNTFPSQLKPSESSNENKDLNVARHRGMRFHESFPRWKLEKKDKGLTAGLNDVFFSRKTGDNVILHDFYHDGFDFDVTGSVSREDKQDQINADPGQHLLSLKLFTQRLPVKSKYQSARDADSRRFYNSLFYRERHGLGTPESGDQGYNPSTANVGQAELPLDLITPSVSTDIISEIGTSRYEPLQSSASSNFESRNDHANLQNVLTRPRWMQQRQVTSGEVMGARSSKEYLPLGRYQRPKGAGAISSTISSQSLKVPANPGKKN